MTTSTNPKPRVLIVDDDVDLLGALEELLTPLADVVLACDGVQAFEVMRRGPVPDLVITDQTMPNKDGRTLLHEMKQEDELAKIPIIMLTVQNAPGDVIAGINAGARQYVTKPFKPDDLLDKVKEALRK